MNVRGMNARATSSAAPVHSFIEAASASARGPARPRSSYREAAGPAAQSRFESTVMRLMRASAEWTAPPVASYDPVYEMLYRTSGDGEEGFLAELPLYDDFEDARTFVLRATTYRGEGFTFQVDPLKPRWTLQLRLGGNDAAEMEQIALPDTSSTDVTQRL